MNLSSSIVQTVTPGLAPDVQVIERREKAGAIRVAAYCRVSTDLEVQKQSLETQISAFQRTISEHPGWVLAGIYADKGISGTSVNGRVEFRRMIEDAKAGKIQYILVKSISRFARNTVDVLSYVRELKSHGVYVYFDREKLDTGKAVSEFLLSILAASAQEEIVSLSNNMKVGRRMRSAAGITQWTNIYGYRKGENGEWIIEESEAKVVRRLFDEYGQGRTLKEICGDLEKEGIPSPAGKRKWLQNTASLILHNEKYIGDVRMQKTFITDPIQHITVSNKDAKIRQYYKADHHPAIVDKRTYWLAMTVSAMRDPHRGCSQYPFYGFLKCPFCGENMIRFSHPRASALFGWTCGGKPSAKGNLRRHRTDCPPYALLEPYIEEGFWEALRKADELQLWRVEAEADAERVALAREMRKMCRTACRPDRKIEYKQLYDLVERITFPTWTTIRVEWKLGFATEAEIAYRRPADTPDPTIARETVVRDTPKRGKETVEAYVIDGVPVFLGRPDRQVEGIERARWEIRELIILEPRSYDPPVPRVFGTTTASSEGQREREAAASPKRKRKKEESDS